MAQQNNEYPKVAVVLSLNDYYIPYASVLLHSIREHASADREYEFVVFNQDISDESKDLLCGEFASVKNFSLSFVNVSGFLDKYQGLFTHGHFVIEVYFRLFIQEVLADYKKVLYLDSDMIVNADIAELFDIDIDGYLLGACLDADTAGLYNGYAIYRKDYSDNILGIKNPYEYFNAGVTLFNLVEMRKAYSVPKLMEVALSYDWLLLDQDILNRLAQGRVKFIDMSWNVMHDWAGIRVSEIIAMAPNHLIEAYNESREHPRIVHYAGPEKPWQIADCDLAEYFWEPAKRSVFFDTILIRMSMYLYNAAKKEATIEVENLRGEFEQYKYDRKLSSKIKKLIRAIVYKTCPEGSKRREFLANIKNALRGS